MLPPRFVVVSWFLKRKGLPADMWEHRRWQYGAGLGRGHQVVRCLLSGEVSHALTP